jgi:hypothetical protein
LLSFEIENQSYYRLLENVLWSGGRDCPRAQREQTEVDLYINKVLKEQQK